MILEYVALGILIFAFVTVFYGIIVIHDIPYEIAVHRNHPHQDAIHYAGWISLFTIGAIWPFLWIWATLYREDRGWGMVKNDVNAEDRDLLQDRVTMLEERLDQLEHPAEMPPVSSDTPEIDSSKNTDKETE